MRNRLSVAATRFMEMIADRLADKLFARLEDENALPLPGGLFDVVVDDPELSQRYEFRALQACSARAAGVTAYRKAMRSEGFRCVAAHAQQGDEVTVEVVSGEAAMWSVVHSAGEHPQINYGTQRSAA